MADILEANDNFTLPPDILPTGRYAILSIVALEILAALLANLFVLIFTMCHPKSLKTPANVFLTNFIISDLVLAMLYMPTVVVTIATGDWLFGVTPEQKSRSCQFIGFIFTITIFLTTLSFTAMSVDRFLFLVKPFIHKRYMNTKVAFLINVIVWMVSILIGSFPFFGVGNYVFSFFNATCVPQWIDNVAFITISTVIVMTCIVIITFMSTWTFCYTRKFVKTSLLGNQSKRSMKKMFGVFGIMILTTSVAYLPGILGYTIGIIIGFENLPYEIYPVILTLFYTCTISNPIVQGYFRKDLQTFIVNSCKKVCGAVKGKRETKWKPFRWKSKSTVVPI